MKNWQQLVLKSEDFRGPKSPSHREPQGAAKFASHEHLIPCERIEMAGDLVMTDTQYLADIILHGDCHH